MITFYKHFELCIYVKMVEVLLTKSLPQSFLEECHLEDFVRSYMNTDRGPSNYYIDILHLKSIV